MSNSFYKLGEKRKVKIKEGDDKNIFFNGWSIHVKGERFEVQYIAARHGGGVESFSISKCDFEAARKGDVGLQELYEKYVT